MAKTTSELINCGRTSVIVGNLLTDDLIIVNDKYYHWCCSTKTDLPRWHIVDTVLDRMARTLNKDLCGAWRC